MTPERKHHITVNYIEPLKASEPFMERARQHVAHANAREFCGLCKEAVRDRAATRKEALPAEKERAFIVLSLWNAAGGTTAELLDNLTNANILLPHLKKLAAEEEVAMADTPSELQGGAPEGATHYRQGNGCAKWYRQHPATNEWQVWMVDAWSRSGDIMRKELDPATLVPVQLEPTQQEPQAMTPGRKQHLYAQYVLSIISDREWYNDLGRRLEGNSSWLSTLPSRALKYVKPLARQRGEELSVHDRVYIYMQLAAYYGHSNKAFRESLSGDGPIAAAADELIAQADSQHVTSTPTLTPTQQEPQTMSQTTTAFETKHYVYGMDVANMSSGQLIDAIKKLEAEIADLKGVKAKSEHIKKRIAELDGMLVKIVEVLDAK